MQSKAEWIGNHNIFVGYLRKKGKKRKRKNVWGILIDGSILDLDTSR